MAVLVVLLVSFVLFSGWQRGRVQQHIGNIDLSENEITGTLYHDSGRPVRIGGKLLLCGNACYGATAGLSGEFVFAGVPAGQYHLYGQKGKCKTENVSLVVHGDSRITIDHQLVTDICG